MDASHARRNTPEWWHDRSGLRRFSLATVQALHNFRVQALYLQIIGILALVGI